MNTCTLPVGCTRTIALSHSPPWKPIGAGHLRRSEAADLDVRREADADDPAFLASPRPAPSGAALVLDVVQQLLQAGRIIAAVVREPGDDVVAVLESRNHVLQADVGGVDAKLVRELVDHPLDHERRFGTAGAAIRLDRRRVGVHAVDVFLDCRDVVDARQHQAVENRRNPRRGGRQVGAHRRPRRRAEPEDLAVLRAPPARLPGCARGRASSPGSSRAASRST